MGRFKHAWDAVAGSSSSGFFHDQNKCEQSLLSPVQRQQVEVEKRNQQADVLLSKKKQQSVYRAQRLSRRIQDSIDKVLTPDPDADLSAQVEKVRDAVNLIAALEGGLAKGTTEKHVHELAILEESFAEERGSLAQVLTCATFLGGYMISNALSSADADDYLVPGAAELQRVATVLSAMLCFTCVIILVATQMLDLHVARVSTR